MTTHVFGIDVTDSGDLTTTLRFIKNAGYNFMHIAFVNPRFRHNFVTGENSVRPFARSELVLSSKQWNRTIVGKISPNIDVDSTSRKFQKSSEKYLLQELQFASYLGLSAVTFTLRSKRHSNLAKIVHSHLVNTTIFIDVEIEVPMVDLADTTRFIRADVENIQTPEDPWDWWNRFRALCNYTKGLKLALEIPADLPSDMQLQRWLAEPVTTIILSTSLFKMDKSGHLKISQAHEEFVKKIVDQNVKILIRCNINNTCNMHQQTPLCFYQSYIANLFKTNTNLCTKQETNVKDWSTHDQLQVTMSEKCNIDSVKYYHYVAALEYGLLDQTYYIQTPSTTVTVLVIGAGKGVLVEAVLVAAKRTRSRVKIYVVDKNPVACLALQNRAASWPETVCVMECDIMDFKPPELIDIVVTELLGSFADNELCPEYLTQARKFLSRDGIVIPSEYTSYISPVQSADLHQAVESFQNIGKKGAHLEQPYVMNIARKYDIDSVKVNRYVTLYVHSPDLKMSPLFTFNHSTHDTEYLDNSRFKTLSFGPIVQNCVLNGFVGYFEAVLYKNIKLSTLPATRTAQLHSWNPIYFPVREPIQIKKGQYVEVDFNRCCSKSKVWYEWILLQPVMETIYNSSGLYHSVELREN